MQKTKQNNTTFASHFLKKHLHPTVLPEKFKIGVFIV